MKLDLDFNKGNGLIPAIIQDADSKQVLMLGYMNHDSYEKSIETKKVHFYSRSRNALWMKGETSGDILEIEDIYLDCDQDALLILARQTGKATCHTGRVSCFYHCLKSDGSWQIED